MRGAGGEGAESDDLLMERYAAGDARAFEALYARWESPLFGFVLRMTGDPEAAVDAFQEVWLRVVEARGAYRGEGRFRSWLFTVARRVCVDRDRKGSPRERREGGQPGERPDSGRSARPDEALVRAEEIGRLLGSLPSGQREALLLSKYHGFTYGEIAEMTGTTEAAVKQKVYRALRSLREAKGETDD